jgi:hypothetical protein
LGGGDARKKMTGVMWAREKGERGCSQGAEELYMLRGALRRGKEELDAGDVVAAGESGEAAWQLGIWPPGPDKRRGRCTGDGGGTGKRRGGRWRPGSSPELKRRRQQLSGRAEQSRAAGGGRRGPGCKY